MTVVLFILASLALAAIIHLTMKIAELSAAVEDLATATAALSVSVDKAVEALLATGQPSTPDSAIEPLITRLGEIAQANLNAKAKLDAALAPPTT